MKLHVKTLLTGMAALVCCFTLSSCGGGGGGGDDGSAGESSSGSSSSGYAWHEVPNVKLQDSFGLDSFTLESDGTAVAGGYTGEWEYTREGDNDATLKIVTESLYPVIVKRWNLNLHFLSDTEVEVGGTYGSSGGANVSDVIDNTYGSSFVKRKYTIVPN